jgi:hypothetical protein
VPGTVGTSLRGSQTSNNIPVHLLVLLITFMDTENQAFNLQSAAVGFQGSVGLPHLYMDMKEW